jgi:hypothetical protein
MYWVTESLVQFFEGNLCNAHFWNQLIITVTKPSCRYRYETLLSLPLRNPLVVTVTKPSCHYRYETLPGWFYSWVGWSKLTLTKNILWRWHGRRPMGLLGVVLLFRGSNLANVIYILWRCHGQRPMALLGVVLIFRDLANVIYILWRWHGSS